MAKVIRNPRSAEQPVVHDAPQTRQEALETEARKLKRRGLKPESVRRSVAVALVDLDEACDAGEIDPASKTIRRRGIVRDALGMQLLLRERRAAAAGGQMPVTQASEGGSTGRSESAQAAEKDIIHEDVIADRDALGEVHSASSEVARRLAALDIRDLGRSLNAGEIDEAEHEIGLARINAMVATSSEERISAGDNDRAGGKEG